MPEIAEQAIVQNSRYSVRQFSPNSWGGFIGDSMGFLWPSKADMLPAWGSLECDIALRVLHYTQHNALWGGASKIWIQKILGTPYEISGGRNLTYDWQELFFESDFGEGYDYMMSKFLTDYLTLNRGGFIEKVSYGDPDTPIKEGAKILGLNHLDALRVYFTGNREYPFLYQSEFNGALHKMHYTRVIHLAEHPAPNTLMYGMGKSALYDALTVANAQTLLGRHQNELLNDLPPPGIVIFNNVKADEVATAMTQFDYERVRDGQSVYRAPLQLSSKDPSQPATVTFVPMSTVPQDFDYEKYMRVHVNLLALTLQLDPQDIWPLQSSAMGSGAQSRILEAKGSSKGPGYLLTRLERCWNTVLPRSLEWKYKAPDAQADAQIANTAKTWTDIAGNAQFMTEDEKRQLVANQVPAFADVLLDESGQVRLYDADPKTPTQIITIAPDTTQLNNETPTAPITTANDDAQLMTAPENQSSLAVSQPKQPTLSVGNTAPQGGKPDMSADSATNKFKDVQQQLDAGLITMAQAQAKLGLTPDPVFEGMYLISGFPAPRESIRDLWQAHFGRGVASFDAVISGTTLPTGNGSGPVPSNTTPEPPPADVKKDMVATTDAYISEILAAMQDGVGRVTTKAGCASRIRGAIVRYGKRAYQDGLQDGGVDPNELDDDDLRIIADDNVWDSQYVSRLVDEIYSEGGLKGTPEYRAPLWVSTLNRFYYDGLASANRNGMYVFTGEDGDENCDDCRRLKGQVHRMKDWTKKKLRPGIDHENFQCGTWEPHCKHVLVKTTVSAQGNW